MNIFSNLITKYIIWKDKIQMKKNIKKLNNRIKKRDKRLKKFKKYFGMVEGKFIKNKYRITPNVIINLETKRRQMEE